MTRMRKTVTHELARACSDSMRDLVPFDAIQASGRSTRLDTAGNRGFSGARIVPGADAWRERETSMRLDPDGWLVRRNVADATIMKTRMRLSSHIGGGVCLSERNEKKCQKLCKGDVLPLDRSLLMGGFSMRSQAFIMRERTAGIRLCWKKSFQSAGSPAIMRPPALSA